jgi:hypothetical protein
VEVDLLEVGLDLELGLNVYICIIVRLFLRRINVCMNAKFELELRLC